MTQIVSKIVDEVNAYITSSRLESGVNIKSFLVFGAEISENLKFRTYKTVTYRLILVHPRGKSIDLYSNCETGNFSTESEKKRVYDKLNKGIIKYLFDTLRFDCDKLIEG